MKNIKYLLILSTFLNANIFAIDAVKKFVTSNAGSALNFSVTTLPKTLKYGSHLVGLLLHTLASSNENFSKMRKNQFEKNLNMDDVNQWCQEVLKKHSINLKLTLLVDIWGDHYEAAGANTIIISIESFQELNKALKTKDNPESQKIMSVHECFLLHEISHLKGYLDNPISPLTILIMNYYLFKKVNLNVDKLITSNLGKKVFAVCSTFLHYLLNNYLISKYHHYIENRADLFAINKVKNEPNHINNLIDYFKHREIEFKKQLNNIASKTGSNGIIFDVFKSLYKKNNKGETFTEWLEKNPKIEKIFFHIINVGFEHPLIRDRINILKQRKAELMTTASAH